MADPTFANACQSVVNAVSASIFGREEAIRKVLACFLAGGHVLIEDRPGVGKSTLAKSFAQTIGLGLSRIQMTADLMPSDVIGGSLPSQNPARFEFRPGPLFAPIVFLDELNRASARTQSALLEAMEERHVTQDGHTYALPDYFFVIATQNPREHAGTHSLPDSQLDRFLMCLSLGMPSRDVERVLLERGLTSSQREGTTHERHSVSEATREALLRARSSVSSVQAQPAVVEYVLDLLEFTRKNCPPGLSPRAGLGLFQCAKAWALMAGRDYLIPDDVQAVFPAVTRHRLSASPVSVQHGANDTNGMGSWILGKVPVRL